MQRNMELVRAILLAAEAAPCGTVPDLDIPGHTPEEISYHVRLLHKAGLIEAEEHSTLQGTSWEPK